MSVAEPWTKTSGGPSPAVRVVQFCSGNLKYGHAFSRRGGNTFLAIPPPKAADRLCLIPASEKTFGPSCVTSKNFSNIESPLPRRRESI